MCPEKGKKKFTIYIGSIMIETPNLEEGLTLQWLEAVVSTLHSQLPKLPPKSKFTVPVQLLITISYVCMTNTFIHAKYKMILRLKNQVSLRLPDF